MLKLWELNRPKSIILDTEGHSNIFAEAPQTSKTWIFSDKRSGLFSKIIVMIDIRRCFEVNELPIEVEARNKMRECIKCQKEN